MRPPTEQLIRDYLNRLSVSARGRLGAEDRRALVIRTHDFIERSATQPGRPDPMRIAALLSRLGDPAALVDQEVARLAAVRGESPAQPVTRGGRLAGLRGRRSATASWHWPRPAGSADLQTRLLNGAATESADSTATPNGEPLVWVPAQSPAADIVTRAPAAGPEDPAAPAPASPPTPAGKPTWPSAAARNSGTNTQPVTAPALDYADAAGQQARPGTGIAATLLSRARANPLEAAAAVLLGPGGAAFPPVWLLGAAVTIASKSWDYRDKWIGLAGPVLVLVVGTSLGLTLGTEHASLGRYMHEGWIYADVLSRLGAVLGTYYLVWRLGHPRRHAGVPPWNRPHRVD